MGPSKKNACFNPSPIECIEGALGTVRAPVISAKRSWIKMKKWEMKAPKRPKRPRRHKSVWNKTKPWHLDTALIISITISSVGQSYKATIATLLHGSTLLACHPTMTTGSKHAKSQFNLRSQTPRMGPLDKNLACSGSSSSSTTTNLLPVDCNTSLAWRVLCARQIQDSKAIKARSP